MESSVKSYHGPFDSRSISHRYTGKWQETFTLSMAHSPTVLTFALNFTKSQSKEKMEFINYYFMLTYVPSIVVQGEVFIPLAAVVTIIRTDCSFVNKTVRSGVNVLSAHSKAWTDIQCRSCSRCWWNHFCLSISWSPIITSTTIGC